jgi:outer membrane protein assembly factor BamB
LSPEPFRLQRLAAKLASQAYIWVESETQDYWRVLPREAGSYLELLQLGYAPAGQGAPLIESIDAYGFRDPVDNFCRTGRLEHDRPLHVLLDQHGAALVALEGSLPPVHVPAGQGLVEELDLASRQSSSVAVEALASGWAAEKPVLIGPLPAVPLALEASLWMRSTEPLEAGMTRTRLVFGVRNPTDTPLIGRLEAVPPEHYALGAASFPLRLEPGESVTYSRVLQGRFEPGDAGTFSLALALPGLTAPGGSVIQRSYRFWVQPEQYWSSWRDGPILAIPQMVGNAEATTVLVASAHGDLAAYDPFAGEIRWERRWRSAFSGPCVVARRSDGGYAVGMVDARGHLRVVNDSGENVLIKALDPAPLPNALTVVPHPSEEGFLWLYGTKEGGLAAVDDKGSSQWESDLPASAVSLDAANNLIHVLTDRASPALIQFDRHGKQLWSASLSAGTAGVPTFTAGPPASAFVLQKNGRVDQVDIITGQTLRSVVLADSAPIALQRAQGTSASWILTGSEGIAAYDDQFNLLWRSPAQVSTPPVSVLQGAQPQVIVGTRGGQVLGLNMRGENVWRDERGSSPLTHLQVLESDSLLLVSGADGSFRCLVIPSLGPDIEAAR